MPLEPAFENFTEFLAVVPADVDPLIVLEDDDGFAVEIGLDFLDGLSDRLDFINLIKWQFSLHAVNNHSPTFPLGGRLAADISEMEEASFPGTDTWHIYCIRKSVSNLNLLRRIHDE
jgi:hypothetical protein